MFGNPKDSNFKLSHLIFLLFHLDHGATVIQRRKDGSVNFDQTWDKYENGFGDFQGEIYYSFLYTLGTITHLILENVFSTVKF